MVVVVVVVVVIVSGSRPEVFGRNSGLFPFCSVLEGEVFLDHPMPLEVAPGRPGF